MMNFVQSKTFHHLTENGLYLCRHNVIYRHQSFKLALVKTVLKVREMYTCVCLDDPYKLYGIIYKVQKWNK